MTAEPSGRGLSRRRLLQQTAQLGALALLGGCDVASRVAPTTPKISRVARVGILGDSTNQQNYDAFREALRGLGWVEGQNITFERRYAEGDNAKLPSLATELLGLSVDVIATGHAPSARAAQQATRTIPIVIAGVAEPVSLGLAESLAYPGGNITGLARLPAQLAAKRLELLKEVLPGLARFAALWDLSPGAELQINATEAAAPGLGLEVQVLAVKSVDDFEAAVAAASSGRAEALTLHGPLFGTNAARSRRIADLAVRARLPSMAIERQYVEAGVLMSYGENLVESWRRAANYTDKILRGANPAELPIELSTAFELVINVTTAQALGLSIPPSVASRVSAWIR